MTEMEWLTRRDDRVMLEHLASTVTHRKLRLLSLEIIRKGPEPWDHPRVAQALLLADQVVEGIQPERALTPFQTLVRQALDALSDSNGPTKSHLVAAFYLLEESPNWRTPYVIRNWIFGGPETDDVVLGLLRDIFGNPFRPVSFDPRWRTADTLGLARGIYEDRAFDRLPLLADALMDAGCADEQVIGHCRSEGAHVRGCWVVDLVLGKE
jgi:hypothetical protein